MDTKSIFSGIEPRFSGQAGDADGREDAASALEGEIPSSRRKTGEEQTATSDFKRLTELAEPLVDRFSDNRLPEWNASSIGWIRHLSSAHKRGKVGEELIRRWARSEGLTVGGRGNRGHDCVVAGLKLEVKTSLRWNDDRFVFLNLRDFAYDAVALLALEPTSCGLWIVPKEVLWKHAKEQTLGASGVGSRWLWFRTSRLPRWLSAWGGTLGGARDALDEVAKCRLSREWQVVEQQSWCELSADVDWFGDSAGAATESPAICG